jgi:hypothetical protein
VARTDDGLHLVGQLMWHWQLAPDAPPATAGTVGDPGWQPVLVTHDDEQVYPAYPPAGDDGTPPIVAAFTFDVAVQVAADSHAR